MEYAIQGQVDNWRYQRRAALASGSFKKGTTETDLYSLPFDDELDKQDAGYDFVEFYHKQTGGLN